MPEQVRIGGRLYRALGRLRIRRRTYVLLEELGNADRQTWKAFDPLAGPGGQYVLIRRLPGETVLRQLRVFRRLKQMTLPRIMEWEQHRHHIDVVLTWFDGIPLSTALEHIQAGRRPPVAPGHVVRLIAGLVADVGHLHRRLQVVHGDIQPANVLITDHPSRLHLIDFGSAWTIDWTTRRDIGDGHHRIYAAPEIQTDGGSPTTLSDQFSVAVVAFQLLTGQLPWGGLGGKAGRSEFLTRAAGKLLPPSSISAACRDLPLPLRQTLDTLVTQSLALDPRQRISTHQSWCSRWLQLRSEFHRPPRISPGVQWLTGVIDWLAQVWKR